MKKLLSRLLIGSLTIGSLLWTPTASAEVQQYTGTGEYVMTDFETPNNAKQRARERALVNAREQAGVYVKRHLTVKDYMVSSDEIEVITTGIVKVVGEVKYKVTPLDVEGGSSQIVATVLVSIDSDDIDGWFERDEDEIKKLTSQINGLRQAAEDDAKTIAELRRQLEAATTQQARDQIETKFAAADQIFLSNQKLEEAILAREDKDFDKALGLLDEAIELNPKNARAYYERGYLRDYTTHHEFEADQRDFARYEEYADSTNDEDFLTMTVNGEAYPIEDYDCYKGIKIIEDYTKVIELDPALTKEEGVYFDRALEYMYTFDDYERAITDFTADIENDPTSYPSYGVRGRAYFRLKQYDRAIADCTKAIELNPNYVNAYYIRGKSYEALGDQTRAQADFDRERALAEPY